MTPVDVDPFPAGALGWLLIRHIVNRIQLIAICNQESAQLFVLRNQVQDGEAAHGLSRCGWRGVMLEAAYYRVAPCQHV